jgi:DegV family protein with EDD domain
MKKAGNSWESTRAKFYIFFRDNFFGEYIRYFRNKTIMSKIAILTDSTANIPAKWLEQYSIRVVPLKIHWGPKTYLDGVDLTPGEFYHELPHCKYPLTTSQPSTQDFFQVFENLAGHAEGIVAPLISSGISGTVGVAQVAAREFIRVPVEIVDTRITSMGQALIVLAAARAAAQGKSLQEVRRTADAAIQRMQVFFTVDTLKYLHRGGRINGASRFLGTALDIKPILTFNAAGKIDALERVRTRRMALQRMITLAEETANGHPVHVAIAHSSDPQTADLLCEEVRKQLKCIDLFTIEFSPVIGVHLGPGAIGIALYADDASSKNGVLNEQPV